jgi:hypothetical protein
MAENVILFELDFHHLSRRLQALERLGMYRANGILFRRQRGNANEITGKFGPINPATP